MEIVTVPEILPPNNTPEVFPPSPPEVKPYYIPEHPEKPNKEDND